ncbi:ABC transporter ATP-binding protein [Brevibacillus brevis]|uniref:ABC transporter ATP-binding protein n=1 Tax=Brevibacillus brevis TaxID=1393 RepID=UPI0025A4F31E|nr:ABC transporter ATP-binding protein [Brevibacillus brevis]WJQ82843.1 ABC transporter ATP-binding protein [Brevibacillus brevis]
MNTLGLTIDQVTKEINGKTIVHPFSMNIPPGQVVALCGGNGAGKSTILRMLVGILPPSLGTIHLNGLNWNDNRVEYLQEIGYMPDHFTFSAGLTAKETLEFYASLRNRTAEEADRLLKMVGLHEVRNKRVSQFSKGMQQRLLFAQAILAKPALVVLDEPTNGLDPYWMDAFVDLVREVKLAGQSVLFTTHQLQVADAVADRAIFLMNGKIVRDGSIKEYQQQYGAIGLYGAFSELVNQAKA